VHLYVAAMVLTNPSGMMVKSQRAVAALRLRMFVTGGTASARQAQLSEVLHDQANLVFW
jgi:hypothetical protein